MMTQHKNRRFLTVKIWIFFSGVFLLLGGFSKFLLTMPFIVEGSFYVHTHMYQPQFTIKKQPQFLVFDTV
jgi:hypothetical protein